jgi:hypothetical protein
MVPALSWITDASGPEGHSGPHLLYSTVSQECTDLRWVVFSVSARLFNYAYKPQHAFLIK